MTLVLGRQFDEHNGPKLSEKLKYHFQCFLVSSALLRDPVASSTSTAISPLMQVPPLCGKKTCRLYAVVIVPEITNQTRLVRSRLRSLEDHSGESYGETGVWRARA